MAFKKLSKATRKKVPYPDLYITKTNATLNMAWCEAVGLTKVGNSLELDFLYDEEEDKFAFGIRKSGGDLQAKYNASHQCQVYLKTYLRQADKEITEPVHCKLKYNKKTKLWIFELDKSCWKSYREVQEASRAIKKKKKKVKRKKVDKKKKIKKKD